MAAASTKHQLTWYALAAARIGLGFVFLWAFFDKLLGLGYATCANPETGAIARGCERAWVNGGSPTDGFLKFATKGPLAEFYQSLAGNKFVAFLFMAGLLLIGIALISGVAIKIAAFTGSLLMLMMWSAMLLPENNPLIDDHIIYIFVLVAIAVSNDQQKLGLGKWWSKQHLVKENPILK